MKELCVLGITGSIGKNVCDVCFNNANDFTIVSCAFNSSYDEFKKIYETHSSIKAVSVKDKNVYELMKNEYPNLKIFLDDICSLIDFVNVDMVVNSLVGFDGLIPTIHTLEKGIDLALANKESLVVGGQLIKEILSQNKSKLYPIDSEHVAIYKLLKDHKNDVRKIWITASGGSFRDLNLEQLKDVSVEQALKHPSWSMGAKITIDSANMMNKGFEIIEAYHLFDIELENIEVLLHDESIIHSMIELKDNSFIADLGVADMRIPISYALYEGNYHEVKGVEILNFAKFKSLHFREYDPNRYPAVEIAKEALKIGGTMPCVLNACNDVVNLAFREGKIKFIDIEVLIRKVMSKHIVKSNPSLKDLLEANDWARREVELVMKGIK